MSGMVMVLAVANANGGPPIRVVVARNDDGKLVQTPLLEGESEDDAVARLLEPEPLKAG